MLAASNASLPARGPCSNLFNYRQRDAHLVPWPDPLWKTRRAPHTVGRAGPRRSCHVTRAQLNPPADLLTHPVGGGTIVINFSMASPTCFPSFTRRARSVVVTVTRIEFRTRPSGAGHGLPVSDGSRWRECEGQPFHGAEPLSMIRTCLCI